MSLLVRKVSTNLKPIILFETKIYLSFLNQEPSTTMNTKSGRAPRKLPFFSIFLPKMITNLPRTNLDMVRIRLKPSFLIFITCSVVPCVTAVKNAISYLANIVEHPAAAWWFYRCLKAKICENLSVWLFFAWVLPKLVSFFLNCEFFFQWAFSQTLKKKAR